MTERLLGQPFICHPNLSVPNLAGYPEVSLMELQFDLRSSVDAQKTRHRIHAGNLDELLGGEDRVILPARVGEYERSPANGERPGERQRQPDYETWLPLRKGEALP
jgi:hypothetical protein